MSGKAAGPRTKAKTKSPVDENEDVSVVEMGWGGVSESLRERCGESVADEELERRPGLEDTADWE